MLVFDKMIMIVGRNAAHFIGGDSAASPCPKTNSYSLTPGYCNV